MTIQTPYELFERILGGIAMLIMWSLVMFDIQVVHNNICKWMSALAYFQYDFSEIFAFVLILESWQDLVPTKQKCPSDVGVVVAVEHQFFIRKRKEPLLIATALTFISFAFYNCQSPLLRKAYRYARPRQSNISKCANRASSWSRQCFSNSCAKCSEGSTMALTSAFLHEDSERRRYLLSSTIQHKELLLHETKALLMEFNNLLIARDSTELSACLTRCALRAMLPITKPKSLQATIHVQLSFLPSSPKWNIWEPWYDPTLLYLL